MDRSIDEVSAISSLVRSLVQQLAESNDNIAKLESIAKAFVPQDEYEQLIQPPLSDSKTDSKNKETKKVPIEEEEAYVIQKLEQERMELVLELQKEDFLKEKLVEVLTQNEDLVETVKEYLESKDSIQKEEEDYVKNRFENYSERVLQPTIDRLDSQLFDLHRGVHKIQGILTKLSEDSSQNNQLLHSKEYQDQLNTLVESINHIYDNT